MRFLEGIYVKEAPDEASGRGFCEGSTSGVAESSKARPCRV